MSPFTPLGDTVNIDVSSSNQAVLIDADGGSSSVRVMNNGTATVWIKFGETSPTAAVATSIPVGPGVTEVFTPPNRVVYAAAIAAGSTGKVYFTPGAGI
jgi:hypothetical protein